MATLIIDSKQDILKTRLIEAHVASGETKAVKPNGKPYNASKDKALNLGPRCPLCGGPVRSFGRGATTRKHGQRYTCEHCNRIFPAESCQQSTQSDAEWSKVADGYDWSCGMQPQERWLKVRAWLEREAKPNPLVALTTMLIAAQAKRICFKCLKEITEDRSAFCWSVDQHLYCGSCYGTPEPPRPAPKVEPLIRELRTMQAILPQALQDNSEIIKALNGKPAHFTHKTPQSHFKGTALEIMQAYGEHRRKTEAITYHWPGGWGRKVEVREAKTEATQTQQPQKIAA